MRFSEWIQKGITRSVLIAASLAALNFLGINLKGQDLSDQLLQWQVKALTTGETEGLPPIPTDSEIIKFTKGWTLIATDMFRAAQAEVDQKSAVLLGGFIFKGATEMVERPSGDHDQLIAEQNLRQFVSQEIQYGSEGHPTHPVIDTNVFEKTRRRLCPVWPFCKR